MRRERRVSNECTNCGAGLEPITLIGYNMWAKVPDSMKDRYGSKRQQVTTKACGECGLITFWLR